MSILIYVIFFVADRDRIDPFDMFLRGKFQGNLQHREVPLVEILPLLVGVDRVLALASLSGAVTLGSGVQADVELVDALVVQIQFRVLISSCSTLG